MKVAILHSNYARLGGETLSVQSDFEALVARGHDVRLYESENSVFGSSTKGALTGLWDNPSLRALAIDASSWCPDVAHVNNTFPWPGASAYRLLKGLGIPIVQHLRNYRLGCPAGTLFRAGKECHECLGRRVALPAVKHACYRSSRPTSLAAVALTQRARPLQLASDAFIALSSFQGQMLQRAGVPQDRLFIRPNIVRVDDAVAEQREHPYLLYIGRSDREKGYPALTDAWRRLGIASHELVAAGPQPEPADPAGLHALGEVTRERVAALVRGSTAVVVPSQWSEPFGRVVLEAYAAGKPVLATGTGGLPELIEDGITGWLMELGGAGIEAGLRTVLSAGADEIRRVGQNAASRFRENYEQEPLVCQLESVYAWARQNADVRK